MPSPIPRRNHRLRFAHFTCDSGLPRTIAGSASALVFSRPAQRSLALWPACSPSPLRTLYIRGFSHFVASTTALIATGWSESCRTGFAPVEKQRLFTAHCCVHLQSARNNIPYIIAITNYKLVNFFREAKQCSSNLIYLILGLSSYYPHINLSIFFSGNSGL